MGIGRACAEALAAAGARVVVQDINPVAAEEAVAAIRERGGIADTLISDVADTAAFRVAITRYERDDHRIDILVNNAGIGSGADFVDVAEDHYDRLFAVNVRAVFFCAQAVVPGMKRRRWGRLINVSSLQAVRGWPGNPHYIGAKAAVIGFARSWAQELAPFGITANTVVPGLTRTPMVAAHYSDERASEHVRATIPMGRLGEPSDIANLVAFLASPASQFISGQTISPNGAAFVGAM